MITEKTFLQRALKVYDNPQCITLDEFKSDLDRFSHIKKLITKFKNGSGPLNERLILNHLVICFNVFGDESIKLALFKVDKEDWSILFPFLILLNRLPDRIEEYHINTSDIPLNDYVVEQLRKI